MKSKLRLLVVTTILFTANISCHLLMSEPSVIVGGFIDHGPGTRACYWENGRRVDLPASGAITSNIVFAMTLRNGTLYSGGYQYPLVGTLTPCYWADQDCHLLPVPTSQGRVNAMCVDVSTVISGGFFDPDFKACYWKNNVLTDLSLTTPGIGSQVWGVSVFEGKILASGEYANSGFASPCYWINGTHVPLMKTSGASASGYSIWIDGATVYLGGNDGPMPCYWTGTTSESSPVTSAPKPFGQIAGDYAKVYSICVYDGNVYAAGWCNNPDQRPCYWIGDGADPILLPVPAGADAANAEASCIIIAHGKIYVSGRYSLSGVHHPCYWVDGVRTDLPGGTVGASSATAIVVK
jgi:hypothetical protein